MAAHFPGLVRSMNKGGSISVLTNLDPLFIATMPDKVLCWRCKNPLLTITRDIQRREASVQVHFATTVDVSGAICTSCGLEQQIDLRLLRASTISDESSLKDVPTTLGEAVQVLLRDMTPESRKTFAGIKEEDLPGQTGTSLGDYCRDCLGLDNRNSALVASCGAIDFEEAVGAVIRAAWEKARETDR